jgi:hypothetical protein
MLIGIASQIVNSLKENELSSGKEYSAANIKQLIRQRFPSVNDNIIEIAVDMIMYDGQGIIPGLDDNYYRPSQEEVLQEYLKAEDLLTINEEHRLKRKVVELKLNLNKFDELEQKMEEAVQDDGTRLIN